MKMRLDKKVSKGIFAGEPTPVVHLKATIKIGDNIANKPKSFYDVVCESDNIINELAQWVGHKDVNVYITAYPLEEVDVSEVSAEVCRPVGETKKRLTIHLYVKSDELDAAAEKLAKVCGKKGEYDYNSWFRQYEWCTV